MHRRLLLVVIGLALGAGAAGLASAADHHRAGHHPSAAPCACQHDLTARHCGPTVGHDCRCAAAPQDAALVPPADLARPDRGVAAAVPAPPAAGVGVPPGRSASVPRAARAPPPHTLLAQRTSFLC